jgi:hypothetical protein
VSSTATGRSIWRSQVAEHEAAHATVAASLGFRPREVSIDTKWDGGYCTHDDRPRNEHNLREHLAVLVAGYVGDRLLDEGAWYAVDLRSVLDMEAGMRGSPDGFGSGLMYDQAGSAWRCG